MPDTSRTCDLQLRKLTLYPSELRAHVDIFTKVKTSLRHPPRKLNVHHGIRDECYYTTKLGDWVGVFLYNCFITAKNVLKYLAEAWPSG